jgi:hypothetical protein
MTDTSARRFTAIHDFWSDETKSGYVAGLSYLARPEDTVLYPLVDRWIEQGLIREGGGAAVVTGRG